MYDRRWKKTTTTKPRRKMMQIQKSIIWSRRRGSAHTFDSAHTLGNNMRLRQLWPSTFFHTQISFLLFTSVFLSHSLARLFPPIFSPAIFHIHPILTEGVFLKIAKWASNTRISDPKAGFTYMRFDWPGRFDRVFITSVLLLLLLSLTSTAGVHAFNNNHRHTVWIDFYWHLCFPGFLLRFLVVHFHSCAFVELHF